MTIHLWSARAGAALFLALGTTAAGPATAATTISHVDGVEMIVSAPDPPPAKPGPHHSKAHAPVVPAPQPLPADSRAAVLLRTAMSLVGTPYVWGGSSPSGFDCSGFTWYAFNRVGISIPRTADVQFAAGRPVAGDPLPGDLVFFQTYDYGASHVGIYIGNGWFVNAIGADVHLASFASPYFRGRYLGARRFLD